jgi:4a-hydroxytetrahydrobiopterin dehydratase
MKMRLQWSRCAPWGNLDKGAARRNLMALSPLSGTEINSRLRSLESWQVEKGDLVRVFSFADFREALAFVNQVGELAEAAGHHPDIDIRYNRVRLALVTHDAGGLTTKDFDLATKINEAAKA